MSGDGAARRADRPADRVATELDAAVARLAEDGSVSGARLRQVRWVAGELLRALNHPGFGPPAPGAGLRELLQEGPVAAYLELAAAGELRTRARAGDRRSGTSSFRVRRDCVALLARAAQLPVGLPQPVAPPPLREPVPGWQRSALAAYLAAQAERPPGSPGRVRLFAVMGVVVDTGARSGELCALRVDDLAADRRSVRLVRRPQARTVAAAVAERVPLSQSTAAALARWLEVREEITAPLQGAKTALWVSVRANHAGTADARGVLVMKPPGMPLQPRGLARAYTRAVAEVNAEMAGVPGWQPLPYRLEQLRRSVRV